MTRTLRLIVTQMQQSPAMSPKLASPAPTISILCSQRVSSAASVSMVPTDMCSTARGSLRST